MTVRAMTIMMPAVMLSGGVPLMVGGAGEDVDVGGMTVMRNGPTVACVVPSEATIWISGVVPTSLASGTPESSPLVSAKVAQPGLFVIEKESARPSASAAEGMYWYLAPALTEVGGTPLTMKG